MRKLCRAHLFILILGYQEHQPARAEPQLAHMDPGWYTVENYAKNLLRIRIDYD
jgi:hypothetical protein